MLNVSRQQDRIQYTNGTPSPVVVTENRSDGVSHCVLMSNDKAPTNAEKWFPGKKYFPIVVSTKKCPLTYYERVVYSYLVFRLRKEQTATEARMVKVLRLARNTVSKAIARLEEIGLVGREQKWYRAAKPNDAQRAWFATNGRTDEPWNRHFATYAVYCPKEGSGLSTKTNALLWLLYSLAPKHGRPVVFGQYLAGLAVMLRMSERGVKQGVERLIGLGLVEQVGTTFLLRQPSAETLARWEDRPIREGTTFKMLVHIRLPNDTTDPDYEQKKDDAVTVNEMLDRHGLMMRKAGCPVGDIFEYWRYVINHTDLTQLWEYVVCNFEGAFKYYAEQHRANGYSGSPMPLVWKKVKEQFAEHDLNTY